MIALGILDYRIEFIYLQWQRKAKVAHKFVWRHICTQPDIEREIDIYIRIKMTIDDVININNISYYDI